MRLANSPFDHGNHEIPRVRNFMLRHTYTSPSNKTLKSHPTSQDSRETNTKHMGPVKLSNKPLIHPTADDTVDPETKHKYTMPDGKLVDL